MQKNFDCGPYVFVHARWSIVGIPPISTLTISTLTISTLTILELTIGAHLVSTYIVSTLSMLQRSIDAP